MVIGDRLRELRESKNLTQTDIEKRTGLLRPYISRVENGHAVPVLETLEKMACALEVPLYQLFYAGEVAPSLRNLRLPQANEDWGTMGSAAEYLHKLRNLLAQMGPHERKLLLHLARGAAQRSEH